MGFLKPTAAKESAKALEAAGTEGRYVVIPVTEQELVKGSGNWSIVKEGVEAMNQLAADGWSVVGTAGHAVVMERTAQGTS